MTTSKSYDSLNRLTQISSANSQLPSPISYAYAYNPANQRTRRTEADGSYWLYEYDSLGQVKRGAKYFSDASPVPGQQFDYTFDDIGNRKTATRDTRQADYTANALNQYSSRTLPHKLNVMGLALGTAAVAVTSPNALNNTESPWRKGEYFRKELSFTESSTPLWEPLTVTATGETSVTGNAFLAGTPEAFTYDLDGNLTSDGRWTYIWDAENRLVRLVGNTGIGLPQRLEFEYDSKGRRIGKKVWNNTAGTGSPALEQKFVYDGWNLLAILSPSSQLLSSFVWGLDLSGSMQGAGGVGGLLAVTDHSSPVTCHFVAYDGNGNVSALVKSADGTVSANYEYGPFGELVRATGLMAKANPFRFSTKYQDDETDLLYYGYRFYNASAGRWLNRDPLNELGFKVLTNHRRIPFGREEEKNLYGFVRNNPVSIVDPFGLWQWGWPPWGNNKEEKKCCKKDDAGTKAAKELANDAVNGLADKLADAAEKAGSQAAKSLDALKKSLLLINAAKSICDAKDPDGCKEFIETADFGACLECCTSIHSLFSNELGGVGFLISCKYACRNAD